MLYLKSKFDQSNRIRGPAVTPAGSPDEESPLTITIDITEESPQLVKSFGFFTFLDNIVGKCVKY